MRAFVSHGSKMKSVGTWGQGPSGSPCPSARGLLHGMDQEAWQLVPAELLLNPGHPPTPQGPAGKDRTA